MQLSFNELLKTTDSRIYRFRTYCLNLGIYNHQLKEWLEQFSMEQLFLIDFTLFKREPYKYLNELQSFFNLEFTETDFNHLRDYARYFESSRIELNENEQTFLQEYYSNSNKEINSTLFQYGYKAPIWLESETE